MIGVGRVSLAAARQLFRIVGALLITVAGCRPADAPPTNSSAVTLTIGVATGENPQAGLLQAVRNATLEGLITVDRTGRPQPRLAEKWSVSEDGRRLRISLRATRFHDGSPLTAAQVREILSTQLPGYIGSVIEDVEEIQAESDSEIEIRLKRPSPFILESLDILIQRSDSLIGTGPFYPAEPGDTPRELRAYEQYYEGKPSIDRIVLRPYNSVRSAWADMLRTQLDMLYEVGTDGLGALEGSHDVAVFAFARPYQFIVVLNPQAPKLRSTELRRALNLAVDRPAFVREAMDGFGTPSDGPIHPSHWALRTDHATFGYEPRQAAAIIKRAQLELRVLVPPDTTYERIALLLKRQLEAVGVVMSLQEASHVEIGRAFKTREFEAVLVDPISGPTVLRPYRWWHSRGTQNVGFSSELVDAALDRIRHAANDEAYRGGVEAFQRAIVEDPPAIFLAWTQRARAVSTRFHVPVEAGRDILSTLRLWRPLEHERLESPD